MAKSFHKPVRMDTAILDNCIGGSDPALSSQLATDAAWALLHRTRSAKDRAQINASIIEYIKKDGVDDVAELWALAHPHSLAGVLWRIYLLTHTAHERTSLQARLYDEGYAVLSEGADPLIVGLRAHVTPPQMRDLCTNILRGVFGGDFGLALDRAAAFCRIMQVGAAGLSSHVEGKDAKELLGLSVKYFTFSGDFTAAARLWRAGELD